MLKALLSTWEKKGERYAFANVSLNLEKEMLSVLPSGIHIIRSRSDMDLGENEEARLVDSVGLIGLTADEKDN